MILGVDFGDSRTGYAVSDALGFSANTLETFHEKNMIKVSLRSVGTFPCNKVAADFFNGGGHLNASGGEYYGTLDEAIDLFKQALIRYEALLLGKK